MTWGRILDKNFEGGDKIWVPWTLYTHGNWKSRHGKSHKHASIACGQFLSKLLTFLDKQPLLQFWPINAHKYVLLSTINPPLLENIWYDGKYCNFGHFYMLRIYVNLQSFLSPKIWLAVKNQLFPCLWKSIKKISFMELV